MKRFMTKKALFPALCLLGVGAATVTPTLISQGSAKVFKPVSTSSPAAPVRTVAAQTDSPQGPGETPQFLVVYSTPYGFEPSEAVVKPGELTLFIRNRTGFESSTYQLHAKSGEALGPLLKPGATRNLSVKNTLSAGDYEVKVTKHPDWVLKLTVKP